MEWLQGESVLAESGKDVDNLSANGRGRHVVSGCFISLPDLHGIGEACSPRPEGIA
jgi:hypothetical protein